MKFLFLFLLPTISSGFVVSRSSWEDENERKFQESLSYLEESLGGLAHLAKEGYPPAQQLVSFLKKDFRKAENSLKEHNEMGREPKPQVLKISQDAWDIEMVKFLLTPSAPLKRSQSDGLYSVSLQLLTESLKLLNQIKENHLSVEQIEIQSRFEEHVSNLIQKKAIPIHPSPEQLTPKCESIFANSFVKKNKQTSRAD